MTLQDQQIWVVGGSRGIGREVAALAAEQGARVTLVARNAADLKNATAELGGKSQYQVADIEDASGLAAALDSCPAPDHVYVAAGQFVGGNILEGAVDDFRRALEARLWGAVAVVKSAAPRMKAGGSFVFTGGVSTDRPVKGAWPTAVATAAAEQLARSLALELAPIRCNAIAPGWTDTPMWDGILGASKAETFATVAETIPVGAIASAREVAEGVLLLMKNRAINGEVLHVDGGHRLV